ncbi:DUF3886 domain-containing protein [Sporosarcina sp. JAI121]|uniref:DUF3886 domain-containing protein n=1 Tax=Sporosarcina sp. JAI121 TaxID=2723064 RepID=UPI0015CC61FA|nr:Skp family chaperone for outer membrane proteins [Sporosarcina sp. JAI121]
MAKKRKHTPSQPKKRENEGSVFSDALDDDILEKLKAAKKALSAAEQEKEEERQEQLRLERAEREKNKSFGELLKEYGDTGSKF